MVKDNLSGDASASINFARIKDALIPFSCYVNLHTLITKDGYIMQTVEVISRKNTSNANGTFRKDINAALIAAVREVEIGGLSFWLHNVRLRNTEIAKILRHHVHSKGGLFMKTVMQRWSEYENEMNYYDTTLYITILYKGISVELTSSESLPLFLGLKSTEKTVHKTLQMNVKVLDNAVKQLMNSLKNEYKISRLTIHEENGEVIAPHLKLFSRLLNADNVKYRLPIADLSSVVNKSDYCFDFGSIAVKCNTRQRHLTVLTAKDPTQITPDLLTYLMAHSRDVITCEILHLADIKDGLSQYKAQSEWLTLVEDEDNDLLKQTRLEFFAGQKTNDDIAVYRQYTGFILIGGNKTGLNQSVKDFNEMLSEIGLVAVREDIGIERAFYSFLPGNFRFIRHSNIITESELGRCGYSYSFDNENMQDYIEKQSLFVLPTINKHAYAFGIPEEKPDIIISGNEYTYRNTLANLIALHSFDKYNCNFYCLDFESHSETFMRAIGGMNCVFGVKKEVTNSRLDLFSAKDPNKVEHVRKLIHLIAHEAKIASDALKPLETLINNICNANNTDDLDELFASVKGSRIEKTLLDFFSKDGKYRHLISINEQKESEDGAPERMVFAFDTKIFKRNYVRDFMVSTALDIICNKIQNSEHMSIVVINSPFVICENPLSFEYMKRLMQARIGHKVIMIFLCNGLDATSRSSMLKIQDINGFCETEFHMFDVRSNSAYGEMFDLTQYEVVAIKKLGSKNGTALLKQCGLVLPLDVNTGALKSSINHVFCDNAPFRDRVQQCIEFYNDDNVDTWLQYFIDDDIREEREGPRDTTRPEFLREDEDARSLEDEDAEMMAESIAKEIFDSA